MTKSIIVTSSSSKGDNIFHCWNEEESFFVFTQRGSLDIKAAEAYLRKKYPSKVYMSIAHSIEKQRISAFFK